MKSYLANVLYFGMSAGFNFLILPSSRKWCFNSWMQEQKTYFKSLYSDIIKHNFSLCSVSLLVWTLVYLECSFGCVSALLGSFVFWYKFSLFWCTVEYCQSSRTKANTSFVWDIKIDVYIFSCSILGFVLVSMKVLNKSQWNFKGIFRKHLTKLRFLGWWKFWA